jgi:1-acyl-sn-glycerol-3-phosphate acyltransferase
MTDWKYEPAHDLALPPVQRWRSVHRESGLFETIVHAIWWSAVKIALKLLHRLSVSGRENLPTHAPFVLVANHASHLDALILAAALPRKLRRIVLPVAAGDTFFETPAIAAFAAWCLNALPLWRKNAGRHALDDLRQRLISEPCGYILFPEGTRTRDGQMSRFKPGLGMLVAAADVSIVPCHIAGAHEAWPPGKRLPRLRKIHVSIGPPLNFRDLPNGRTGWERIATQSEAAVRALSA